MVGKEIFGSVLGFRGNFSFFFGEIVRLYLFGRIREFEKLTYGVFRERIVVRVEDLFFVWDWKFYSFTGGRGSKCSM